MKNKPSAVRHGNGNGVPIETQAQHCTLDCLNKLKDLLNAQKTTIGKDGFAREVDDHRLQFTVAKFLLELAWGRAPVRKEGETEEFISPQEAALKNQLEGFRRVTRNAAPRNVGDVRAVDSGAAVEAHRAGLCPR